MAEPRPGRVSVLFVCTGNICRSPTAEGVMRKLVAERGLVGRIDVDSAGTHDYHVGEPPDPRTQKAALRRGVQLGGLRARMVDGGDFERFDFVVALDHNHHRILSRACPQRLRTKLHSLMEFAPDRGYDEVPDPYYSGPEAFELVLDLCEAACAGLLAQITDVSA
jgi:protein-tyrosine phosphatase